MKKIAIIQALFIFAIAAFPLTVSAAPARENVENSTAFKDVEGKDWILEDVKSLGQTIHMDRKKLEADNFGGIYTINFKENRVSGMGAPNRYFGPYTLSANKTIKIDNVASTMMAAFKEPDELKEREFFNLLSKVTRWNIMNGKLELYGTNANGNEVTLVFLPIND